MKRVQNAKMHLITFFLLISLLAYNLFKPGSNKIFLGLGILFCLMGVMINIFLITNTTSNKKQK